MAGSGGLAPDLAALAFEAFQQRGFFAADVGAGADAHFDIEVRAEPRMSAQ